MRKSLITQELANAFPEHTKVRSDEQSVGQSLLNVIGLGMEPLTTELYRAYGNMYLSTANVGEIDLTYRVQLPDRYQFDTDRTDAVEPLRIAPTVSGLLDTTWLNISEVTTGTIKDFWYEAIPTRITEAQLGNDTTNLLISTSTSVATISGQLDLIVPNRVYIKVVGTQFFDVEDLTIPRARIRLTGTTWKGTTESEDLIFLFNSTRQSNKVWSSLTRVDFIDFPEVADIQIYTLPFNLDEYVDPYNDLQQQKDSRNNLPVFWKIETTDAGVNYLEVSKYRMPLPTDLLNGQTDLIEIRRWELLDTTGVVIDPVDVMPIPFSRRTWVTTASGLYLYDLDFNLPDLQRLTLKTVGPNCKIELSSDYTLREEDVSIDLIVQRPIKTIVKYRLSITYPDTQLYYVVDDDLLDPDIDTDTEDFWVFDIQDSRLIRSSIIMAFEDRGEHLLTLEVTYADGTVDVDQRLLIVDSKTALFENSLTVTVSGIAIDHLQRLLVATTDNTLVQVLPHYDVMLVDYNNKQLVFREPYDEVKVML